MLVDNDPDARGPNRLLEVVQGGDYGYKSVFGGSGRHPFQGWDGSFPGTLPFLSGTGEAPSGIIDASSGPSDSYLATIWNENTIERHTVNNGAVQKSIFMAGDKNFRPVALAYDSHGNLYITDWMLVDYPNHGKGRIWRVSNMPRPDYIEKTKGFTTPSKKNISTVLSHVDPFTRHSGEMWLSQPEYHFLASELTQDENARVRMGAYLALRRSGISDPRSFIRSALTDADVQIRRLALMWAAEQYDPSLRPDIDEILTSGPINRDLFNAYLAAIEILEPNFSGAYRDRSVPKANRIPRSLKQSVLHALAKDSSLSPEIRALTIERLPAKNALDYLASAEGPVRMAAIQRVSMHASEKIAHALNQIALNESEVESLRAEALLGLSRQFLESPEALIPLLDHSNQAIAIEATRLLRLHSSNPKVRQSLLRISGQSKSAQAEIAEHALFGFDPQKPQASKRPQSIDTWKSILADGGDPSRGSRVFRSPQTLCMSCHGNGGQGNEFGPSLAGIGQSLNREAIIHAILRPSDSFSPDFQAWTIETNDGKSHQGVQIDHQSKGSMLLYTLDARENVRFEADEIRDYRASKYSLMPSGLENTMTVSEFRDLVAYLAESKTP